MRLATLYIFLASLVLVIMIGCWNNNDDKQDDVYFALSLLAQESDQGTQVTVLFASTDNSEAPEVKIDDQRIPTYIDGSLVRGFGIVDLPASGDLQYSILANDRLSWGTASFPETPSGMFANDSRLANNSMAECSSPESVKLQWQKQDDVTYKVCYTITNGDSSRFESHAQYINTPTYTMVLNPNCSNAQCVTFDVEAINGPLLIPGEKPNARLGYGKGYITTTSNFHSGLQFSMDRQNNRHDLATISRHTTAMARLADFEESFSRTIRMLR